MNFFLKNEIKNHNLSTTKPFIFYILARMNKQLTLNFLVLKTFYMKNWACFRHCYTFYYLIYTVLSASCDYLYIDVPWWSTLSSCRVTLIVNVFFVSDTLGYELLKQILDFASGFSGLFSDSGQCLTQCTGFAFFFRIDFWRTVFTPTAIFYKFLGLEAYQNVDRTFCALPIPR